jgi:glutathionylspermidine synthase
VERHAIAPRDDWQAKVEAQGLIWHSQDGEPYWDERAYYAFDLAEIEKIEAAAEAVYGLFLEAGDRIVDDPEILALFGIPEYCHRAIKAAWRSEPPSLNYGRFDFGYTGEGEPKLFEFNCDTPTSMLEAAVVQWDWKETLFPELDQFNSLHEKLLGRWAEIRSRLPDQRIWFTHAADPSHEDTITTTYMRDLAGQAGLETLAVLIDDIGLDARGRIVDSEDQLITAIFKLYPWEWIVGERYGQDIVRHLARDRLDRADLEDAVEQQGGAPGALGDVPRSSQPARRVGDQGEDRRPAMSPSPSSPAKAPTSKSSPTAGASRARPANIARG